MDLNSAYLKSSAAFAVSPVVFVATPPVKLNEDFPGLPTQFSTYLSFV